MSRKLKRNQRLTTIKQLSDITNQHRNTVAKQVRTEAVDLKSLLSIIDYVNRHRIKS